MGSARGRRGGLRGRRGAAFIQQRVGEVESTEGGNVEVGSGWRARRRGRGGRGRGQQKSDDTRQMAAPGKLQIAVLHEPEVCPPPPSFNLLLFPSLHLSMLLLLFDGNCD